MPTFGHHILHPKRSRWWAQNFEGWSCTFPKYAGCKPAAIRRALRVSSFVSLAPLVVLLASQVEPPPVQQSI